MAGAKGRSGGHNRKRFTAHQIDGTYRTDRHSGAFELRGDGHSVECPDDVTGEARAAWERLRKACPDDGLTPLDVECLRVYSQCWKVLCDIWPAYEADPTDKALRGTAMALLDRCNRLGRQFGIIRQ